MSISNITALFCIFMIPPFATASNCFHQHLKEAKEINIIRKPLYETLSNGKSRNISDKLIASETFLMPLARYLDSRAGYYQGHGINLLCDELVPMDKTPPFNPHLVRPDYEYRPDACPLDVSELEKALKIALKEKDFGMLAATARKARMQISGCPDYLCMLRHLLESVEMASNMALLHREKAREKGLKSPEKISIQFLWTHVLFLKQAKKIDLQSIPLQEAGIPVICQDVPCIYCDHH